MTAYTAYPDSILCEAGKSCDGHPFVAEVFFVVVESEDGRRLRHQASFAGAERVVCEETGDPYFVSLRSEALAKAEHLASRVNTALESGISLNHAHWREVEPVYLSDAYHTQGIECQNAAEEREAAEMEPQTRIPQKRNASLKM
jgi:hypothetical protein